MILQSARPVLLSILAIVFGVVQLSCVCANAEAAHIEHQIETSFDLAHSILVSTHQVEPDDVSQPDHNHSNHNHLGDHQHDADCAHCEDANRLVVANDGLRPVSLPSLDDEDSMTPSVYTFPVTRVKRVLRTLDGLQWHNPPASTLVTLKIRLTL